MRFAPDLGADGWVGVGAVLAADRAAPAGLRPLLGGLTIGRSATDGPADP